LIPTSHTCTRHALARAAQRAISAEAIDAVLRFADIRNFIAGGLVAAMVTQRKLERLERRLSIGERESLEGVIVLIDPRTGAVVSAFHDIGDRARVYRRRTRPNYRRVDRA
jgi:hypothetical protein